MPKIKLLSEPKIIFAHTFSAAEYSNFIPKAKDTMEISYISDGKTQLRIHNENYENQKYGVHVNLKSEDYYIKSLDFHEHHTVCFSVKFKVLPEDYDKRSPFLLRFNGKEKIHALIDDIIRTNTLYPEKKLTVTGLFLQLIDEINCSLIGKNSKKADLASLYVLKAKDYVYKHMSAPIQQKDVARYLDITPEYLCYVFKKETGTSLIQFINTTKLTKIRQLIVKENLKLYEAAALYGFSDPNYVSKLHKKYFGYSVTESGNLEYEGKK